MRTFRVFLKNFSRESGFFVENVPDEENLGSWIEQSEMGLNFEQLLKKLYSYPTHFFFNELLRYSALRLRFDSFCSFY